MLQGEDDQVAVIELDEESLWNPRKYTWKELRLLVVTYARAMRSEGVVQGDVVACKEIQASSVITSSPATSPTETNDFNYYSNGKQLCPVFGIVTGNCSCGWHLHIVCYGYRREGSATQQAEAYYIRVG